MRERETERQRERQTERGEERRTGRRKFVTENRIMISKDKKTG